MAILQILEGFLQSQIPLVKFEDVGKVTSILAEIREKAMIAQTPVWEKGPEHDKLIIAINEGTYSTYSLSRKSGAELLEDLDILYDLKEHEAELAYPDLSKKIDVLIDKTQGALEYLTLTALLDEQKRVVRESCNTSATIAGYKLQECEQTLRQMIALHATSHSDGLQKELKQLEDLAKEVAEAKGKEHWNAALPDLDKFKKEREAIKAPSNGRGINQQKLEILQQEASLLQNTVGALMGKSLEDAIDRMNSLNEEAVTLSNAQSKAYNTWTMERIKACLQKGREGVGYFINGDVGRKTIGRALIDELGPIDRRFLTNEVSRAFDEVMGKYLAPNQLMPVKRETDLDEEGTILYTLNQMHETKKRPLSEF